MKSVIHQLRASGKKRFLLYAQCFLLSVFCLAPSAFPQAWLGILNSSRATDWSNAGVTGGIPSYSNICQVVGPSGDASGSTDGAAINSALSTCAAKASASSPQVVLLAAGTFYSNIGIGFPLGASYLVLRGQGPDRTTIKFLNVSSQCSRQVDVCLGNSSADDVTYAGSTAWLGTNDVIGTYARGASVLDVASTSGLVAGQPINFDQRNDSVGLCPQSGGVGNCSGVTGLTNNGSGTVTAVTSIPYPAITAGAKVYVDPETNDAITHSGGYESAGGPWTVASATTTGTNTTFTYTDGNTLSAPTNQLFASVDNGGIYTCDLDAACVRSNSFAGRQCTGTAAANQCQAGEISLRSQDEVHTIKAICTGSGTPIAACKAANEIVIDGSVMATNYDGGSNGTSDQAPGVWWEGTWPADYSQYAGIEDLTVDDTPDQAASPFAIIELNSSINCWVKNVRTINATGIGVALESSNHDSVVDSYLFGTKRSASQSYGVDLAADDTSDLIENNITQHVISGVISEQSVGNVVAYNFSVDSSDAGGITDLLPVMDMNHGFADLDLAEGNDADMCMLDDVHGSSWGMVFFRNRCRGQDTPLKDSLLWAATPTAFERAASFIGNVLGTSGAEVGYSTSAQEPPDPPASVYVTESGGGTVENGNWSGALPLDPAALSTLMRWGNYDSATGATHWCGDSSNTGWTTTCSQVTGGSYTSGGSVTGSAGQTCILTFTGGGSGAVAAVALTGANTIASGTALTISDPGFDYSSAPTSAVLSSSGASGSATCSGTATVSTSIASVSEIPTATAGSGATAIAGTPVPSSTALPASFYLSAQPSFWVTRWGTPAWPGIGPDVTASGSLDTTCGGLATGCDGLNHMSYLIPAQICFNRTPMDPSYQKTLSIKSAGYSSGIVTLTLSANDYLSPPDTVLVSGANSNAYNGLYVVNGPSVGTPVSFQAFSAVAGSGPPAGTYQVEFTWTNSLGETAPSPAASATSSGSDLSLYFESYGPPTGATGFNVYLTVAGGSTFYLQASLPVNSSNCPSSIGGDCQYTFTSSSINTGGAQPPTQNSTAGDEVQYSARTWTGNTNYPDGATIFDSNGNIETAITPGTSGTAAPSWTTTTGATTLDASVTWQMSSPSPSPGGTVGWPNILLFNAARCYPQSDPAWHPGMSGAGNSEVAER